LQTNDGTFLGALLPKGRLALRERGQNLLRRKKMKTSKRILLVCLSIVMLIAFVPMVGAGEAEKININKADLDELSKLTHVGKGYAQRIIEYREKNGPFKNPEDITEVKGIGDKVWQANKDRISVK
jgi:competence protein ComEA